MYEPYWQLTSKPFEQSASGDFFYPGESQQAAGLKLRYVIENRSGAGLLCGAPGVGKSLLMRWLFQHLPDSIQPRRHLVFPQLSRVEWLRYLADELDVEGTPCSTDPSADLQVRRIQRLLRENHARRRQALIVIDDAHLLDGPEVIESLRLLLNFEVDQQPALNMILVGQPTLVTMLDRFPAFEERLGVKCLLRPFSLEETVSYVNHRLHAAGSRRVIFTSGALEVVYELSEGIPRRINRLGDLALLVGFAEEAAEVTSSHIESVAEELITVRAD